MKRLLLMLILSAGCIPDPPEKSEPPDRPKTEQKTEPKTEPKSEPKTEAKSDEREEQKPKKKHRIVRLRRSGRSMQDAIFEAYEQQRRDDEEAASKTE